MSHSTHLTSGNKVPGPTIDGKRTHAQSLSLPPPRAGPHPRGAPNPAVTAGRAPRKFGGTEDCAAVDRALFLFRSGMCTRSIGYREWEVVS